MPRVRPKCSFCRKESVYKLTPHLLSFLGVSGQSNLAAKLNGAGRHEQGGYFTCMDHLEEAPAVGRKRRHCSLNVTGSDLLVCGAPLKAIKLEHDYLGRGSAPRREPEPANPKVWEAGFDCREETVPTFGYEAGAGESGGEGDGAEGDEAGGDEGESEEERDSEEKGDSEEDEGSEYVPSQSQEKTSQDSQPPGLTPLRM